MAKKANATHPNADAFPPGISGPALRALAGAGIRSLAGMTRWTESDLAGLHGMGPSETRARRIEAAVKKILLMPARKRS